MSYHFLYNTARWQRLRKAQLKKEPLCAFCNERGFVLAATVVDHIKPHKGDKVLFYKKQNLQSLCKRCHDQDKQIEERRGYRPDIALDGWPIDQKHPANNR